MSSATSRTTVGRVNRRARLALLAVLAAGAAGCAKDAPQDTWQPAGDNAQKIQNLQWPVFLIAGIVGVIVVRRRRLRRSALPRPRPGDPRADPRQAGARDRPHDPAGADPRSASPSPPSAR